MVSGEPDGTVRFRTDITLTVQHANYPFPPGFNILNHNISNVADGDDDAKDFTEADWGTGENLYIFGLQPNFNRASEFNKKAEEGILLSLQRETTPGQIWGRTFQESPINIVQTSLWQLSRTYILAVPLRVISTDKLTSRIRNESGQTVNMDAFYYYFTESS